MLKFIYFLLLFSYASLFPALGMELTSLTHEPDKQNLGRESENNLSEPQPVSIRFTAFVDKVDDAALSKAINEINITQLQELICPFQSLTDKSFDLLQYAENLKILDLGSNEKITDIGISKIQHLKKLEELFISGFNITDASVPYITQLTSLKRLDVYYTPLSKEAIEAIKRSIPALQSGSFIYNKFLDMKKMK